MRESETETDVLEERQLKIRINKTGEQSLQYYLSVSFILINCLILHSELIKTLFYNAELNDSIE